MGRAGAAAFEALAHLAETGTPPDDPAVASRFSAGLGDSLGRVRRETLPFLTAGGSDLQFVHGPYGRGKTHFLRTLSHCAREQGFVTAYVDCADGESPFRSLRSTYRSISRAMTPPDERRFFSTSGVGKAVEARFTTRGADLIQDLRRDRSLTPDFRNVVVAHCTHGLEARGDEELADDLEALLSASLTYRVTVGGLYRDWPGLPRPLGKITKRNAAAWLRSLLLLPRQLGYPGLIVLFDETETVLNRGGARARQQHLAHIRTFVDHLATGAYRGCAVYYAVAEEFLDTAREGLGALAQRIERVQPPGGGNGRNPRAVWVDVEELTVPGTRDPRFFEELTERVLELGIETGVEASMAAAIRDSLRRRARSWADALNEGRVRDFVKHAASKVSSRLSPNGA